MATRTRVGPVCLILLLAIILEVLPLPDTLELLRPPFPAIVVIYWTMMWPNRFGIGAAWLTGLVLDILHGSILGQNALALSIIAYITLRFHLQIRIFPLWQLTLSVFALLVAEEFLVLWINGVAGIDTGGYGRWTRIIVGTLLWPPLMALMDGVRLRIESRRSSFN
ncbi:MAG: rod shape-determining protein MreD [Gammaproteobacteria bacterium]